MFFVRAVTILPFDNYHFEQLPPFLILDRNKMSLNVGGCECGGGGAHDGGDVHEHGDD